MPLLHDPPTQLPSYDQIFAVFPTPSLIFLAEDPMFPICSVNNAYLEVTGLEREQLLGKGFFEVFDLISGDKKIPSLSPFRSSLEKVLDSGKIHKIPLLRLLSKQVQEDGNNEFFFNIEHTPVVDKDQHVTHILHSVEDVTVETHLENSYKTNRQRFINLYSQAPICMGMTRGSDHIYEMANPLLLELIGRTDVLGKPLKEVLPELENQGFIKILNEVYTTGETYVANEAMFQLKQVDGGIRTCCLNFTYQPHLNHHGKVDGIYFFAVDVTEQVEARKKVEATERRHRELLQHLPLATYSCNLEGKILFYNTAARELWGQDPEPGKDIWCGAWKIYDSQGVQLPLGNSPMALSLKEKSFQSGGEIILERPNGERRNVKAHPVPLYDSESKIYGALNLLIDITENKLADQALLKSEKKYRQIVETAQEGIWVVDRDNITTFVNDKLCEILEYSREEMLGQPIFLFMNNTGRKIVEQLQTNRQDDYTREGKFKYITKSGKEVWAQVAANPLYDDTGVYSGSLAMLTDITDRKHAEEKLRRSEKRLRESQEVAHLGNWELNFATGRSLWSDEACRIYGVPVSDNSHSYEEWLSFVHPDDMEEVMRIIKESQTDYTETILHNRIILRDGTVKYIYGKCKFEFDAAGNPIGLYGITLDVTERKKAERALELQNEELVKTNKELDRFVYSASHDLRAPLTSIMGLLSFIEEDSREPDTLEHVGMIRTSINRLDSFIKNILSYSQNNRTEVEPVPIDLNQTVAAIVDSLRGIYEAQGIDFRIDITEDVPFCSDLQRVSTVLENLISNAVKYHTDQEADRFIKISGAVSPDQLQLSISDNGIGISREHHQNIFDMFFRLSGKINGSGIGLYIVKDTVEKLKGTISVESEKGQGSTFTIILKNLNG